MKETSTWYAMTVASALSQLESAEAGITNQAAEERLKQSGPNELKAGQRITPWAILFEQFKNIFVIILLLAAAFRPCPGHGVEAIAITVIVLFSVILGFVQEYRAERAIEALREMAAPTATVLRDGDEVESRRASWSRRCDLAQAGDRVPADARLIESINLQIEEAVLTGESLPVEKHTRPWWGRAGGW
jgi:P-type Ca2+ transporter type 2C